ncbi:hypothetical protein PG997_009109 [Apiospora hydei]|uniref:Uncharacterized protein n=1 Tax=Apiospora hydei TaxID=1337664 RepID=A0ABR1VT53_9PEZI
MSFFWRSPPPKAAVEIGEGCKPGTAARGTDLYIIEREIRDKLDEEPDFDSLKEMKAYIESMDFLKKDGTTVNVYFVDECMKHHCRRRVAGSVASGASRTTASDVGSISPSTRHTISSSADNSTAAELQQHLIPFQLMTTDRRWRFVIARKTTSGTQNYMSTKIAGQCGFSREPGASIDIKLELLREQLDCSVHVREMEQDMLLTEALVVRFSSYRADYQLDDYFHESTVTSCRLRAARLVACSLSPVQKLTAVHSVNGDRAAPDIQGP